MSSRLLNVDEVVSLRARLCVGRNCLLEVFEVDDVVFVVDDDECTKW